MLYYIHSAVVYNLNSLFLRCNKIGLPPALHHTNNHFSISANGDFKLIFLTRVEPANAPHPILKHNDETRALN